MTFLEFICRQLLGGPRGGCYACPFCEHDTASLAVRPPKGDHRIRFRCHRCAEWGDEFDLLKAFPRYRNYSDRLAEVARLRAEYDAAGISSPTGRAGPEYQRRVEKAWADLRDRMTREGIDHETGFALLERMYDVGYFRESGRLVGDVLVYQSDFAAQQAESNDEWIARTDGRHMAECDDPACDWVCCRAARGLPPVPRMTPAERAAERSRKRAERQAAEEEGRREVARIRLQIEGTLRRAREKARPTRR